MTGPNRVLVFDAGPLITFACARALDDLGAWVSGFEVRWPAAVRDEIAHKATTARYAAAGEVLEVDWLEDPTTFDRLQDRRAIEQLRRRFASHQDPQWKHAGEAAAIHLAVQLREAGQPVLLTADWEAANVAKEVYGLSRLMTLEMLCVMVHRRHVSATRAWQLYQTMRDYSRLPDLPADYFQLCQATAQPASGDDRNQS